MGAAQPSVSAACERGSSYGVKPFTLWTISVPEPIGISLIRAMTQIAFSAASIPKTRPPRAGSPAASEPSAHGDYSLQAF